MAYIKSDLVVKSNTLINASHTLTLAEQKLIALAIIEAREIKIPVTDKTLLEVRAIDYADMFNVSKETAYETLRVAVEKLFERNFEFDVYIIPADSENKAEITNIPPKGRTKEGHDVSLKARWVEKVGYSKGAVYIQLSSELIPFVTDLKSYFTQYYLSQTVDFTSGYANRLFELVLSWKAKRKTPLFELEDLRAKLGVEKNKYSAMCDFKKRVLDVAVEQVSKGEFIIKYHQHKQGRKIVGFSFTMRDNPKHIKKQTEKTVTHDRDKETIDWVSGLSDKQINYFGNLLANDDRFNSKTFPAPIGLEMNSYEQLVKQNLRNPDYQKQWIEDLERVGFKLQ